MEMCRVIFLKKNLQDQTILWYLFVLQLVLIEKKLKLFLWQHFSIRLSGKTIIWRTLVIFVEPLIPPILETSGDVCPRFQSEDGSFACFLVCVILSFTSGVTPADCIEVSMAAKTFQFAHLQTYKHWWWFWARTHDHLCGEHSVVYHSATPTRLVSWICCWRSTVLPDSSGDVPRFLGGYDKIWDEFLSIHERECVYV